MILRLLSKFTYGVRYIIILFLGLLVACQSYEQQYCLDLKKQRLPSQKSLNLHQYQAVISRKPIKGIKNLSGLTWNNKTKSLFAVTNKPPQILELSTQGELLRTIKVKGIRDPEAIEYVGGNEFIVSDERFQKIFRVQVDKDTLLVDAHQSLQYLVSNPIKYNKGLEGLAYDRQRQVIYAANESAPIRIFKIIDFFDEATNTTSYYENDKDNFLFIKDISGLHFYQPYGHLLALSDESKLLLEINKTGQPISCLPLSAGNHGLFRTARQPEGVTVDDEDNLYIISEPNLFYLFKKMPSSSSHSPF